MAKTQLIVEIDEWVDRGVWLDGVTLHDRKRLQVTIWIIPLRATFTAAYDQWQHGTGPRSPVSGSNWPRR